jgi:hypothetical protein
MRSDSVGTHALMWTSLNKVSGHSLLAERPAGFQSVKSFNKDEAAAVAPDENGRLLADGQHALGNRNHLLWIEGLAPLDRHIDVEDGEGLRLQHRLHPFIARPGIPRVRARWRGALWRSPLLSIGPLSSRLLAQRPDRVPD